jgi:hypothetical protein
MFEGHCMNPPFYHLDFESISLGEDVTDKVNSTEVTIETGTWYRGLITEEMASSVRAENAIALVESLEWYFRGGSFYKSQGERCSGKIGSK